MEAQVSLYGMGGEEQFPLAVKDHQEPVQGLMEIEIEESETEDKKQEREFEKSNTKFGNRETMYDLSYIVS